MRTAFVEVLDDDFDADDGSIIEAIRRTGAIAVGPEGMGVHALAFDQIGMSPAPIPAAQIIAFEQAAQERARLRLESEDCRRAKEKAEKARLEAAKPYALKLFEKILQYPHANRDIAGHVADEFVKFGERDARRRGIAEDEWLWRRSRYLAGHR